MLIIKPKHTVQSVAQELAHGLRDGSILLNKPAATSLAALIKEINATVSGKICNSLPSRFGTWAVVTWRGKSVSAAITPANLPWQEVFRLEQPPIAISRPLNTIAG